MARRLSTHERRIAGYIAAGIHSCIPPCCIAYFVAVHTLRTTRAMDAYNRLSPGVGYVPCPECGAARRFVRVHVCARDCVGKPGAYATVGAWESARLGTRVATSEEVREGKRFDRRYRRSVQAALKRMAAAPHT